MTIGDCQAVVADADPGEALGAVDRDELGQVVEVLARELGAVGHDDRLHGAALGERVGEDFEPRAGEDGGAIDQLEPEAGIGRSVPKRATASA